MNLLHQIREKRPRRGRTAASLRGRPSGRSLRRGRSLLLVVRTLALLPVVVLVRPGRAERMLRAECLLVGRDRASLLLERRLRQRDDLRVRVLRDILRLGPRGVSLLRLALAGKDHELALVELQARNVLLKTLRAAVLAAVIHRDTDGARELLRNARLLELIQGEALAQAHLGVVALRRAADGRAQVAGGRARGDRRGLLLTVRAAALLATSLVEPGPDIPLPPLLVMDIRDHLVVLHDMNSARIEPLRTT